MNSSIFYERFKNVKMSMTRDSHCLCSTGDDQSHCSCGMELMLPPTVSVQLVLLFCAVRLVLLCVMKENLNFCLHDLMFHSRHAQQSS